MSLAKAFLAKLDEASSAPAIATAGLEAALARMLAGCRSAWPTVRVDDARFVGHVAAHLGAAQAEATPAALEALHAADLYLAFAGAEGDPAALSELDKTVAREVTAA